MDKRHLTDRDVEDIELLRNYVVSNLVPDFGHEDKSKLLSTYGETVGGLYYGWMWYRSGTHDAYCEEHGKKTIEQATKEELLAMVSIVESYWSEKYLETMDERIKVTFKPGFNLPENFKLETISTKVTVDIKEDDDGKNVP